MCWIAHRLLQVSGVLRSLAIATMFLCLKEFQKKLPRTLCSWPICIPKFCHQKYFTVPFMVTVSCWCCAWAMMVLVEAHMLIAFSESLMLNRGLSFFLSGLIFFSLSIWIFLRKFFLEKTVCIRIMCWDSWLVFTSVVQENKVLKFLGFMWNPLSWVMEAAALMAIALANGQVLCWSSSFCCFQLCLLLVHLCFTQLSSLFWVWLCFHMKYTCRVCHRIGKIFWVF